MPHCQWCVLKSHYFHTSWLLKCYTDMIHCLSHDIFWIHWVLSGMHLMWQTHYTQLFKSNMIVAGKNILFFSKNIDLIVRQRRQKINFISFMIKFSSDQQCQNVISWLWPNLVIACWLCGSVPSNGKYLMIAIHRTRVRYDARPWPSAFKCNDQSRAGLCQPEVECVLAQFGHGNKINMFLFSPV